MKRLIVSMVILVLNSHSISAEVLRGQDIIDLVSEWAVEHNHSIVAKVNPNRVFFECSVKPSIKPRNQDDLSTLNFSCNNNDSDWQISIRTKPTKSSNTVTKGSPQLLVSAAKPIKKNSVIRAEDLILIQSTKSNTTSYFQSLDDVIGRKAKRTIYRDQLIKPQHVTTLWLVEAGQNILIVNKIGRIRVETIGIALENGQKNDIIKVENAISGETVTGIVENEKNISVLTKMN
jgi:flagella basal body P-ring formation protein FlgA